MLYILFVLIALLLLVGRNVWCHGDSDLKDFNIAETLPLRGFLAIGVMLTHLCPHLVSEAPLLDDFGLWGPPSVASFFLLTGYGLSVSYMKKGEGYLHGFFKKRLLRLLWPLLLMTIVFQAYKIFMGIFNITSLLCEPSPMTWFIYALLIWYVGFYVSFKIGKNRKQRLSLIWLFTMLYVVLVVGCGMTYYYISILPLPMAITYVYYENKTKAWIVRNSRSVWWCVLFFVLLVMGYSVAGQYGANLPGWGLPVNILAPWVLVYVTYCLGGWKNRVTIFLGKISYEFYIVHGFVVMLLGDVHLFCLAGYANAFCVMTLILVITVLFAWLMNLVCTRINVVIK